MTNKYFIFIALLGLIGLVSVEPALGTDQSPGQGSTISNSSLLTDHPYSIPVAEKSNIATKVSHGDSPPDSKPTPTSASIMRLEDLIAEALTNNPEIQAAERMVDAKRAVAPQARTLPDPTISAGWAGNLVPPFSIQAGDPSSSRMLGVTQEIPFPGKLSLRGRIAETEADTERWAGYERTKLAVISNLKQTYYDLFFIDKSIEIVQKDKDLLETLAKIAEARYTVGKGTQQDVIRAQLEISRLLERLTLLEQRKAVAEAMLSNLLYRQSDAPVGTPEEIMRTDVPYSLKEIEALGESNSPALKAQEKDVDKNQLTLNLAKKEYYPDLGVGFTYFNRPQMPDMYSVNITAKVPLYFWKKQRYGVEEAASSLVSSRRRWEAAKTDVLFKLKDQYLAMKASERLMELYSKVIVPQSTLALDSSLSSYQVGSIDFLSMLTNYLTVLDYELSYYDSLTNYQKALAKMEEIAGIPLSK